MSSNLPPLAPLEGGLSEEERKARQRLHVKRTYYRKLHLLQGLRDQVHRLEDEFTRLSAQHSLIPQSSATTDVLATQQAHTAQAMARLVEVEAQLRRQNATLQSAVTEFETFKHKMQSFCNSRDAVVTSATAELLRIPTLRVPISVDKCHVMARDAYEEMRRFRASQSFTTTGMSVFGWRDKRVRDGDYVKFSLQKTYPGITPLALSRQAWGVVASPAHLPQLYTAGMNMKIYPLQYVDEDNVIMFRTIKSPDGLNIVKTFFLISRFETPEGLVILLRSMDPSGLNATASPSPGVQEHWNEYFVWTTFEPGMDDRGLPVTHYEFGGEVKSSPIMGSDGWMLEVLLITLRWETMAIGPVFSLHG